MPINKINTSFCATIKGDQANIIKLSMRNGLSKEQLRNDIKIIHNACPKTEDKVYLYYRDRYDIYENFKGVRSGVKVFKDGVLLEKNIDPRDTNPKFLLHKFATTVRDLVSGAIQRDETVKLYDRY
ncbi:hypothetical protein IJS77_01685 [bacterium]|nr:hypothetical protein [bacterium]